MELLTFSCNFDTIILYERSSSDLVGPKAFIFSRIIGHDV